MLESVRLWWWALTHLNEMRIRLETNEALFGELSTRTATLERHFRTYMVDRDNAWVDGAIPPGFEGWGNESAKGVCGDKRG